MRNVIRGNFLDQEKNHSGKSITLEVSDFYGNGQLHSPFPPLEPLHSPTFPPQRSKERFQEEWTREKRELEQKLTELQAALLVERRVCQTVGREM